MIRLVLLDIEGTTLPISFVRDVMFPYAAKALPELLTRQDNPKVVEAIADIAATHPGESPLSVCESWMAKDEKAAPLKSLQGIAWKSGFDDGALKADLYPDVPPALRSWHDAGLKLAVYSSGSVQAQKLLYGHTAQGDLTPLFSGFFDLSTGGKKDSQSYARIAESMDLPPAEILFLSDIGAELDAARQAGLQVCQLVRSQDGTIAHDGAPQAATLEDVSSLFSLPS